MTPDQIRDALKQVHYPGFSRDIISFGLVKEIAADASGIRVHIEVQTRDPKVPEQIFQDCHAVLDPLAGDIPVKIEIEIKDAPATPAPDDPSAGQSSIPGVKKIIAVASGKGGVGKSTVSANLAVALANTGARVGLCDCDLYGPSIAMMFGTDARPLANERDEILPIEAHGIQLMSMGFLLEDASPVIVRGPLATRYTQQFLRQVAWDDLDYLVLDLPPGTGDIQLTIVQTVAVDGVVVVTTPQEVALIDARKAVSMFGKVNVPVIGMIENMAWFECEHGTRYHLFGDGGGVREAERLGVPVLARIPIDPDTCARADNGNPVALLPEGEHATADSFHMAAAKVATITKSSAPK